MDTAWSGPRLGAGSVGALARIGWTVLGILAVSGTGARAESIDEAMGWALRSSFDRKADDERQAAVEAQVISGWEAFLPTMGYAVNRRLDSKIKYSPDFVSDPTVPGGTDALQRWQPNTSGFQLSLPLFDGFKRYNDLQAARSASAAGRGLQDAKAQQILLDTASAYLAVLRDRAIVQLREAAIADVSKVARSVALRREVHDATNAEAALAESRVIAATISLEQAKSNLVASETELVRLAGPAANPTALPLVPNALLPSSLGELRGILVRANPTLVAARLDAESAAFTAKASYAQFLPQLSLEVTHGRRGPVSLTPYRVQDTSTMLQALIPIYQPGEFGNVAREHAIARQKSYVAQDLENTLIAQATAAFKQRRSTIEQVGQAEQRVRKITRAVQGRQMELRLGSMTVVDILNTVAELAEARVAKINLEFARDRATYALAAVVNRLRG
ncbi:TolC family protein [Methylobacterium marchantiae]|uniref:TolC family protein n=1 Tax=Methylobacterium marchantiae TaxID=600331 RepID=A0ABW3X2D6_9HYPH|nr:Outer membrane efflux protein BepC [Methylobacterium marchantiae]